MTRITAPFTDDQAESIKGYQKSRYHHPFTCGTKGCHHITLWVSNDGFHCGNCYRWHQTWCHDFMADWSWKKSDELMDIEFGRKPDENNPQTL
jgi:hypothetical protein